MVQACHDRGCGMHDTSWLVYGRFREASDADDDDGRVARQQVERVEIRAADDRSGAARRQARPEDCSSPCARDLALRLRRRGGSPRIVSAGTVSAGGSLCELLQLHIIDTHVL